MESPTDPQELDSDDDEIDYSVKPEFYDPDLDTKDELWVHKKRKGHSSDAVLNCPACFTTLCLDCQRLWSTSYFLGLFPAVEQFLLSNGRFFVPISMKFFFTQYRAMFVLNCKIKIDQILRSPSGGRRQQRQRKPNGNGGSNSGKTVGSLDKEAISGQFAALFAQQKLQYWMRRRFTISST